MARDHYPWFYFRLRDYCYITRHRTVRLRQNFSRDPRHRCAWCLFSCRRVGGEPLIGQSAQDAKPAKSRRVSITASPSVVLCRFQLLIHDMLSVLSDKTAGAGRYSPPDLREMLSRRQIMSTSITVRYSEFAVALAEVLAENAIGLARRGRLARARAAIKKHPD
jgi:hypothetical protein